MPTRLIKESICESKGLASCSVFTQDLFKRMITYADDYGRFNADTQIMLARLYPRETDVITHDDIINALIELCGIGKICFYTSMARKEVYGCFPNWSNHQRIRNSKQKCPDPTDTTVNDWYFRRFIPVSMKLEILERDDCNCKICNKDLNPDKIQTKRLIKLFANTVHFDHIVPCNQGGRATLENIQTTCAKCNLTRKRSYTFDEIVNFSHSGDNLQKLAATCGEMPPNPIQSNPIRIQSESNPIRKNDDDFKKVVAVYQNEIGIISPITAQLLADCLTEYSTDWIISAIKEAVTHGGRTFAYVDAILRNWKTHGFGNKRGETTGTDKQNNKQMPKPLREQRPSRAKTSSDLEE